MDILEGIDMKPFVSEADLNLNWSTSNNCFGDTFEDCFGDNNLAFDILDPSFGEDCLKTSSGADSDWIKSSSDVNSDSSFSMSPLPPSPLDSDIMVTEEVLEDDPPSPTNTVTVGSDEIILSNIHKTLQQASIELHNYSSNFQDPAVKVKEYKSSNVSPSSSTSSSSNVRKSGGRGARGKPITELTLTEEEKRLLSKEGYADFPSGNIPLTKQEEKVLRKVRRKIRNKRSAQCSRQRKKEYVDELEKKYEKCASENDCLRREVMKLRKENSSLMLKMKNFVGGAGQTSLKTSFFVLILSFLLVLVPFFRPDSLDDSMVSYANKEVMATGRHLLMAHLSNDIDSQHLNAGNESEAVVNMGLSSAY